MFENQYLGIIQETPSGPKRRRIRVNRLFVAGWTGRDKEAMEHHIRELEELGVERPKSTPIFYRVSTKRLTTSEAIQVTGEDSSGEVEFVLLNIDGEVWVGVGSDHTDRKVETYGVTYSKQICDKPMAEVLWRFEDVIDHWDELQIRSYAVTNGSRELYQEGPVSKMLAATDLLRKLAEEGNEFGDGDVMFCGTLPAINGLSVADRFEFELYDPVREERIGHGYDVCSLPIHG